MGQRSRQRHVGQHKLGGRGSDAVKETSGHIGRGEGSQYGPRYRRHREEQAGAVLDPFHAGVGDGAGKGIEEDDRSECFLIMIFPLDSSLKLCYIPIIGIPSIMGACVCQ